MLKNDFFEYRLCAIRWEGSVVMNISHRPYTVFFCQPYEYLRYAGQHMDMLVARQACYGKSCLF